MRDFHSFRMTAINYWECHRVIYNVALIPPSVFAYKLVAGVARVGANFWWHPEEVFYLFALSAVGANFCYSFAYAVEFLFGSNDPSSRWIRFGRKLVFVAGILLSILLAFDTGARIAHMEYHP